MLAQARPALAISTAPASGTQPSIVLHIFGVLPESPFAAEVTRVFEGTVEVRYACDGDGGSDFDAWAWQRRLPALRLELRPCEVLIGPLALPGRAGCGYCASARMAAAEAAARLVDDAPGLPAEGDPAPLAAVLLEDEVRSLLTSPPEQHRLLHHVLIANAGTRRTSLHRVIPLPGCPVCAAGTPAAFDSLPARGSSTAELVAALAGYVDPRTGIISRMQFEASEAPVVVTASPPHVPDESGGARRLPVGWGKGLTVSGAILSAVGESIERYSASLPEPARIVWKRPADLDGDILSPEAFALYGDDQYARGGFPYFRFDRKVSHPWIRGQWLGSEDPVWIPAVFAFLSLKLNREQRICQGTSNGLAASGGFEEAALRATFELIERDAFMAAWLTGSAGRRLDLAGLQPELRQVLAGVEGLGAAVELYALETCACGASVLALAFGDGEQYPGVTVGIGADLDPLSAVRAAILELGQTGPHLQRLMRNRRVAVPEAPRSVRDMIEHAVYYFPRDRGAAFDRMRGKSKPVAITDLARPATTRSLAACAETLKARNIRVALADVTSADVAMGPFRVVRAVSPDLQPISYGYGFDRLPVERVRRLGLASDVPAIHPIW